MGQEYVGRVKFWRAAQGWGFVTTPGIDGDVFVHYSDIASGNGRRDLDRDARVRFEVSRTEKGWQAQNVRQID